MSNPTPPASALPQSPQLVFADEVTEAGPEGSHPPGASTVAVFDPNLARILNVKAEETAKIERPGGKVEFFHMNDKIFDDLLREEQSKTRKKPEIVQPKVELGKRPDIPSPEDPLVAEEALDWKNPASKTWEGPWKVAEHERQFVTDAVSSQKRVRGEADLPFYLKTKPQEKFPGEMDPNYPPRPAHDVLDTNFTPSSTFHLESDRNYQNESYFRPPKDRMIPKNLKNCFVPRNLRHTYKGHTKDVSAVRFFPKYGHYLLTASYDKTIRLWDVFTHRKLVRTYVGHTEAVGDLSWSNDGSFFLSSGFDSRIQHWDAETGKVIRTYPVQKHPYCVKLNPDPDRQHLFLTGNLNGKIDQYDLRLGSVVTQYTDHVAPVNCILFVDNNKKFVSCGDDRKIFLWEFGTPVILRNLNEPNVQQITRTDLHPSGSFFIAQTTDNKILVFDVKAGELRLHRKKSFVGHVNAAYPIRPAFSPNGFYVLSGDHLGRVHAWDWKTEAKIIDGYQAHNSVVSEIQWHPNDAAMTATGSKDCLVKLWSS